VIKTLYVLHHSHTDIGYTHGQGRITRWHGEFIRQAMDIAERRDDFAWTCETFFPLEAFWKSASEVERQRFVSLARQGRIGLSGSYFNFNELPDRPLLDALHRRARVFADQHGLNLSAAMTADINGTTLAYARSLADAGVELLITFIHPHHGHLPFGRRAHLADWDLGDGRSIRMLQTDYYHVGNELGLCPGGETAYLWDWADPTSPRDEEQLERRLPAYLKRFEEDGWPYDFFVIAASGLITDNGPPGEDIADRIARWNAKHGDRVTIRMVPIDRIAEVTRGVSRPTVRGDCPDWWADGVAGDPEGVALLREAQRRRAFLVDLGRRRPEARCDLTELDTQLALFAEHTFGHSGSVRHPANLMANQLRARKIGYAAAAADTAEALGDAALDAIGCGPLHAHRRPVFRAIHVGDRPVRELVSLLTEWHDVPRWGVRDDVRITRLDTNEVLPHQRLNTHRGAEWIVDLSLEPGEVIDLRLDAIEPTAPDPTRAVRRLVADRMHDVIGDGADVVPDALETPFVRIPLQRGVGIGDWLDAASGRSLLNADRRHAPFAVVASRLDAPLDGDVQCDVRRKLGRNRNGGDATWSTGVCRRIRRVAAGAHLHAVELGYELAGCEMLSVRLAAWTAQPRVDVEVVMHKLGTWNVENLYLALPFSAGGGETLWVDRGAGPMRPGVDQWPATLIDYLGVQDGVAWCGQSHGVAVAQRDSHLVQFGPLEYGVRQLADGRTPLVTPTQAYAWLMTNYWETNFAPEVGGFYSFRYSVLWGDALHDPFHALLACRDANRGVAAQRLAGQAPAR
jgi:hypothetical protein